MHPVISQSIFHSIKLNIIMIYTNIKSNNMLLKILIKLSNNNNHGKLLTTKLNASINPIIINLNSIIILIPIVMQNINQIPKLYRIPKLLCIISTHSKTQTLNINQHFNKNKITSINKIS